MDKTDLKLRTKSFALQIIKTVEILPKGKTSEVLSKQLLRSATSVGANYRAACRARSTADFIAKMCIVEEEADESIYWMELLSEAGIVNLEDIKPLIKEANELLAIVVASINTVKNRTGKLNSK